MHLLIALAAMHRPHGCVRELIIYTGTLGHPSYIRHVLICPVKVILTPGRFIRITL